LSGSATQWESLDSLIRAKAARFPNTAWLLGKPRFEALRVRLAHGARAASNSAKEYISLGELD
jgi:hypothetical protein